MNGSSSTKISHGIIKSLYNIISYYNKNRGVGKAGVILNYFNVWKELHALTVNISKEGWDALKDLARQLGVSLNNDDERWLFLFAVETYLHILSRALALSKLGRLEDKIDSFIKSINSTRNIFPYSIFEWVFEAYRDQSLPTGMKKSLIGNIEVMLIILYNLNTTTLTFDAFRELYQNVLPREIRRSLGEFYTREDVIDEVLDAAGLDANAIQSLYSRWRRAKRAGSEEAPIILDPACGSGSFLLRVADRIFKAVGCRPDIASFIEDILVGIDINPFAVELARLNMIVKLSDLMTNECKSTYTPSRIKIYWGDSLARVKAGVNLAAQPVIIVNLPVLAPVIDTDRVRVPRLKSIAPARIVDIAYGYVRDRRSFEEFLERVASEDPSARDFEVELKSLYEVVGKIHRAGNERLVELLKNVIMLSSLEGACDYVIGNPPWVRVHRVARHVVRFLRQNYSYFDENSTYNPGFKRTKTPFAEQHDYSVAFVERGLELLREGGVLSYVITSKVLKSMYAGALRSDLIENYRILEIRDYSLHPRPLFEDVVNYPLIISVKKEKPPEDHKVKVTIANTLGSKKHFTVLQPQIPFDENDKKSPWLVAPPEVIEAFRNVIRESVRLGDIYEVHRGVMTSADSIFIGKINSVNCEKGTAIVEFEDGSRREVELHLLHPFVRGRGVDPFTYSYDEYIVFTHDTNDFKPLWDYDQRRVLEVLGLLSRSVKARSAGSTVVYVIPANSARSAISTLKRLIARLSSLQNLGYDIRNVLPCSVRECYEVTKNSRKVLEVKFDIEGSKFLVYVEGLRIPGAPNATRYFLEPENLRRLLGRDDYKASLPPWAVFRVSSEKFRDYRIAWQEIALHFEAAILPSRLKVSLCNSERVKLLVPNVKVYFIVEPNIVKASKLILYLNSDLARTLLKLRALTLRGGYYEHQSTSVGALPIPDKLLQGTTWSWIEEYVRGVDAEKLNDVLKKVYEEYEVRLTAELVKALGLSDDEYNKLVEWGAWLNEQGNPKEASMEVTDEVKED